ncbi:MFS transporter [Caenispirillum salinarum]|uniref:MFS transporter n=1 Tax=Caenispirillum salinarum TaxID=859058 RepID=UPI00384A64C0
MMPTPAEQRAVAWIAGIAHFFSHLFEPIFYVVALVLPTVFDVSYEAALTLIIVGKLLYGLAAPAAGWLGDRWSATGMMAVFFLGLGVSGLWAGMAGSATEMMLALAALGLFGSIYHPVGIAWLVRSATSRGKALGFNGIFGGLGPAVAGVTAGGLVEWLGWRAAFIIPSLVVLALGVAFVILMRRGVVRETRHDAAPQPEPDRRDTVRAYTILALCMVCGGLIYQSTQSTLPKVFEEGLGGLLGDGGTLGVGTAVMIVYGVAGFMQLICGHLADRFPLKYVYVGMYLLQIPMLAMILGLTGAPLLLAAVLAVTLNIGALPAENSLLAKFTPARWRATAYGLKFVLAFGVAGLGVQLAAWIRGTTGDFFWLYALLAGAALVVAVMGIRLPGDRPAPQPAPAPVQAAE